MQGRAVDGYNPPVMQSKTLILGGGAWLMLCIAALPAWASSFRVGDIIVSDPWSRPSPPSSSVGSVYLTLRNVGRNPDRLIGVRTPRAASAGIHETVRRNGMVEMNTLSEVALPPGSSVEVKPGGLHIMLIGLTRPLTAGAEFPLTLVFAGAGPLVVTVRILAGAE
jgi:copper(I)-binding protein